MKLISVDIEEELYRKEYNALLASFRDETGLSDAAAISNCPDTLPEAIEPWVMSDENVGDSTVQYKPKAGMTLIFYLIFTWIRW